MAGVQSGTHSWELSLSLVMLALTPGNVRIELDSRALRYAREGKKKKHIYLMSEMLSSTCSLLCTVVIL